MSAPSEPTEYVTGGNVHGTTDNPPITVNASQVSGATGQLHPWHIMSLVGAAVATVGALLAVALITGQLVPQPYVSGHTFHAFTKPSLSPLLYFTPLIPVPFMIWLGYANWRIEHPGEPLNRTWLPPVLAINVTGLMAGAMVVMLFVATSLSISNSATDPQVLPTWFNKNLHIQQPIHLPTNTKFATATSTDGKVLTFRYEPTAYGYTLTLVKTTPLAKTKPASTITNPAPSLELPGTSGTVHTHDADGNPVTYTYTRDSKGHYTIDITSNPQVAAR